LGGKGKLFKDGVAIGGTAAIGGAIIPPLGAALSAKPVGVLGEAGTGLELGNTELRSD